tara:strand:- start:566 stop:829 length:264 start_codon:yes stop_codon:yes gene_type:complete
MSNVKSKPVEKLRDGAICANIWKNDGQKGPFFSATFERTYTDEAGKIRNASSFSGTELLRLSWLAGQTYDRITDLKATARAEFKSVG